ncbi:MAG: right-handed parallel beta-helix repeat-containing protein [Anaerolineales bacterium]
MFVLLLVLGSAGCGPSGGGTPPSLGGDLSIWYVAPNGSDSNNTCHTAQSPCQTIEWPITHAYNGAVIHIADGTYTGNLPILSKGINLEGSGPNTILTEPKGNFPYSQGGVIYINCPNCYSLVTIANLTIQNGWANSGGAVYAANSKLTMNNVTISGGAGGSGGGLYIEAGATAILDQVTISHNQASGIQNQSETGLGGGIYNAGTLTMTNSTVSENTSAGDGGGIYNLGKADLTGMVIDGNSAPDNGYGGGIENYYNPDYVSIGAVLTLTNSTLRNNHAGTGAGLFNENSHADITGTTINNNTAQASGGGILQENWGVINLINSTISGNNGGIEGGGIASGSWSTLDMSNDTIADNQASKYGGLDYKGGDLYLINIILAANSGYNCSPGEIGGGFSISSDNSCDISGYGFHGNLDPMIGPLQNNGGPTETHALLAGSPAIDTGTSFAAPDVDQRGAPRPIDGNNDGKADWDIGAFEYGATAVTSGQVTFPITTSTPGVGNFTFQAAGPCFSGPGPDYAMLAQGVMGETAPVDGRSADGAWFHVQLKPGIACWVSGRIGTFDGNPFGLPTVQSPPTPTPTTAFTPTLTLTPTPASFFKIIVKPNHIYYRGAGCGDKQAQFQVQVADPAKVAGVWLFVRLKNKSGGDTTDWSEALVMTPIGSGWYSYLLLSEDIPNFTKFPDAWVQYQFVAYDKSFTRVATSDVLGDVEVSTCGM